MRNGIAAELRAKLGIRVSPRTVRQHNAIATAARGPGTQVWNFVRTHARAVRTSDFFVVATFRLFDVFVVLEVGTRDVSCIGT